MTHEPVHHSVAAATPVSGCTLPLGCAGVLGSLGSPVARLSRGGSSRPVASGGAVPARGGGTSLPVATGGGGTGLNGGRALLVDAGKLLLVDLFLGLGLGVTVCRSRSARVHIHAGTVRGMKKTYRSTDRA